MDLRLNLSVQHSELRAWLRIGNLWNGPYSTFDLILHGYSDGYIFEDSFRSLFSLVLHEWDSVPDGSLVDPFQSSVCVCVCSNDVSRGYHMNIANHVYHECKCGAVWDGNQSRLWSCGAGRLPWMLMDVDVDPWSPDPITAGMPDIQNVAMENPPIHHSPFFQL